MRVSPVYPLRVFFDGGCGVCTSEMRTYRTREHGGRLVFIDIRAPWFDPAPYSITGEEFLHELHAIDASGHVYRGVDAFRAIWKAFPDSRKYDMLNAIVLIPGVNLVSKILYRAFARIRGHLPKM
jgi:predicted DCC family thiol-disulfide oxidoreductase YuxK